MSKTRRDKISQLDIIKSIRKPMVRGSFAFKTKKSYNRKDKSWKGDI